MSYHNTFKYDRNEPHFFSLCLVMLMCELQYWSGSLLSLFILNSTGGLIETRVFVRQQQQQPSALQADKTSYSKTTSNINH